MATQKTFDGVTLHGMPVRIELQWPFHSSGGGSDWYVLHGTLRLADGGPLYADIALNLGVFKRDFGPVTYTVLAKELDLGASTCNGRFIRPAAAATGTCCMDE